MTDLKLALRMARKTPGLTFVATSCLAVGIGLTTAAFHIIYGAFLSPLPVADGNRIAMVREYHRAGRYNVSTSPEQFRLWRENARSFEALGAWQIKNVPIQAENAGAFVVRAAYVTPNALEIVAAAPRLGRSITSDDAAPGAPPVIVLSDSVWRSQFAASPGVLGATVRVAGEPHQVIGVMPPRFAFPVREYAWIPLPAGEQQALPAGDSLQVFAKLHAGSSLETAQAEMATLRDPNVSDLPARAQTEVLLRPFTRGFMAPEEESAIYAALLGLLLFLLVMAGNLSNLLLARNSTRMREIALRFALGAKRSRLVRQLLAEAALLGAASAGFGLLVARGCVRYVEARVNDLPWWFAADVSTAMVGAAALAALVASAAAGISPAAKLTRHSVSDVLKQTGAVTGPLRFGRLGNALIAAQMAIAIGLVSAVGLLAQSLFGFGYEKYGLPAREVLVTQLYFGQPEGLAAGMPAAERRAIWKRFLDECHAKQRSIQERVAAIPGVRNAAYASLLPGNDVESARIELHADLRSTTDDPQPLTRVVEISPAFFDVLGARFVQGRDFLPLEHTGEPRAVIVNAPFARKHFGGAALGRRLRLVPSGQGLTPQPWVEVVGVVPDLGLNPGDPENADGIYLPLGSTNVVRLAIRSQGEPSLLVAPLHEIVALAAPRAQVQWAVTLQKQLQEVEAIFRGLGSGLLLIGGTALLLTAVSLYSLISFSVTQRTREIGVRLALGASRWAILQGVFRREGMNVAVGAGMGVALAIAITRLVALMPFGMRAGEPKSLIACAMVLTVAGFAACFVPLRRALRIQPGEALRHD